MTFPNRFRLAVKRSGALARRVRRSLRDGDLLRRVAGFTKRRLLWLTSGKPDRVEANAAEFDRKFGLDTATRLDVSELDVSSPNYIYANIYGPTPPQDFREMLLSHNGLKHEDFVLLDAGSGKGLILLVAADFGFKEIVGVEFAKNLHQIAIENLAKYKSPTRRCFNVRPVCSDITAYSLPDEPTVIFMNNSFQQEVMTVFLDNIEKSHIANRKPIYVLYFNPQLRWLFERQPFLRKITAVENRHPRNYIIYEVIDRVGQTKDNVALSGS